jgi:hypothetical protein
VSRVFNNNTANFLSAGSAIASLPFTIAGWFKPADVSTAQVLWSTADTAGDENYHMVQLLANATIEVRSRQGASSGASVTAGTVSVNTWTHVAAVLRANNTRQIYLNGTAATTDATALTPAGLDNFLFGKLQRTTSALPFNGKLGQWAFWASELSGANITSLAGGDCPDTVGTPAGWWPLLGTASPEPDDAASYDLTINGTVSADTGDDPTTNCSGGGGGGGTLGRLCLLGVG